MSLRFSHLIDNCNTADRFVRINRHLMSRATKTRQLTAEPCTVFRRQTAAEILQLAGGDAMFALKQAAFWTRGVSHSVSERTCAVSDSQFIANGVKTSSAKRSL